MRIPILCSAAVVCLTMTTPNSAHSQFDVGHVPVIQAGAPVQVTGVGMDDEKRHIGFFVLRNDSAAQLELVQLGWTLHECGRLESDIPTCHEKVPFLKGVSGSVALMLHPGQSKRLDAPIVDVKKLETKVQGRGVDPNQFFLILFGIATARFGDGTEWEYDIVNESSWKWKEETIGGQASPKSSLGCDECSFACFSGSFCRSARSCAAVASADAIPGRAVKAVGFQPDLPSFSPL